MLEGTPRPCPLQACVKKNKKNVKKNPHPNKIVCTEGKKRRSRRRGYFSFSSSSLSLLLPCMPWAVRNCLTHCLSTAEASLPPSLPVQQEVRARHIADTVMLVSKGRGALAQKERDNYTTKKHDGNLETQRRRHQNNISSSMPSRRYRAKRTRQILQNIFQPKRPFMRS